MGAGTKGAVDSRPSKLTVAMIFLETLKHRSLCGRLKVSALIADRHFKMIHAMGYNGPAQGEPHDLCRKDQPGNCGCVHAEANALIKLRTNEKDLVLFCSNMPCEICARLIVNSGAIGRVIFIDDYRSTLGLKILKDAQIAVSRAASTFPHGRYMISAEIAEYKDVE